MSTTNVGAAAAISNDSGNPFHGFPSSNGKEAQSINGGRKSKSKISKSSSATRLREMEIELAAQEALAKLEEQRAEREKILIMKRLEIEKMKLNEEEEIMECEKTIDDVDKEDIIGKWVENATNNRDWEDEVSSSKRYVKDDTSQNALQTCIKRQCIDKNLPFFDGNPTDWLTFINEYEETTAACKFTNVENLVRLRKSLKGDARQAVKMLLISHHNVPNIIETLSNLYGRPEYVIKSLIDEVKMTQPPKEYKPESLVKFSCTVNNLVTAVKHLGRPKYLYNFNILQDIIELMPASLKQKWAEYAVDIQEASLEDFAKWISRIGKAAGMLNYPSSSWNRDKEKKKNPENMFYTAKKNYGGNDKCKICENGKHKIDMCQKFNGMNQKERWQLVKEKRLCISCLKPNHSLRQCFVKKSCGVNQCKWKHHQLLHTDDGIENETQVRVNAEVQIHEENDGKTNTKLRIIPVTVEGPKGKFSTYALLDDGSTVTLIDSEIYNRIGLEGEIEPVCLQWTNNTTQTDQNSRKVDVNISGTFKGAKHFKLRNARTIKSLGLPRQSMNVEKIKESWPHLKHIPVKSFHMVKPLILIGSDNYDLSMPRNYVEDKKFPDGPKATLTKLGWVISGPLYEKNAQKTTSLYNFHVCEICDQELQNLVKESFKLERNDEDNDNGKNWSQEDKRGLDIMKNTAKRIGQRFEIGLLWRYDDCELPESKTNAMYRLQCQERKMDRNKELGKMYCMKIEEYLNKGYLRKLSPKEIEDTTDSKVWYLPHFAVFNPNKPGKLRIVFDAAAKSHGFSLNDMLVSGPVLITSLIDILWKFRQRRIAFCGDIREMFHQVRIREEDQTAQRILWRGFDRDKEPDILQMQVMTFGAVCSPSASQFIKNLNAEEFKENFPRASDAIINKHYVDDYLDCCDNEEDAIKVIQDVIYVHKQGGFEICNFSSNSRDVLRSIPEQLRQKEFNMIDMDSTLSISRVLGLHWNAETDNFIFRFNRGKNYLDENMVTTKRNLLKMVMSVYDPLGFLSHITITGKILLQEVWREGCGWDETLPEHLLERTKSLIRLLINVTKIEIPRCYSLSIPKAKSIELHTFCDASSKAFSVVSYLRIEPVESKNIEIAFVSAKSRVCPLKSMTIPKLELQAALLGSRLANKISKTLEIQISKCFFWTDSRIVLYWLKNNPVKKFSQFISHRVEDILNNSETSQWNWVPTQLNVADEGTRAVKSNFSEETSLWLKGPEFLRKPKEEWPREEQEDGDQEIRIKWEFLGINTEREITRNRMILPDITRFSSWLKLIRVTAWTRRFVNKCKKVHKSGELTPEELCEAEKLWLRKAQSECFNEEIRQIQEDKRMKRSSKLRKISVFLDEDGIMKVRGRIRRAWGISESTKNPIILDSKHLFTRLLVEYYHKKMNHQGKSMVINSLKQKYWIIRLSNLVKLVWRNCRICKIRNAKPSFPLMGELPAGRLAHSIKPFTFTGLDYFGPLEITTGRRREKRYGALFTCLTIRAVHLELVSSLTTDSAIMAISRMSARRGCPQEIFSDNGTNFRGANNELLAALEKLDQDKLTTNLSVKGIKWHFNPPGAPHMGGSWESLVKSVKRALQTILKEQAPKEEVLRTLFAEAEYTVNSRPLTDVSLEADDEEALTPNHFLLGTPTSMLNELKFEFDKDVNLQKQWKFSQHLSQCFWKRWLLEYLPTLVNRKKWQNRSTVNPKIGDIVVIIDEKSVRNTWPKGRIMKTYPGQDNVVRVVDVKTEKGIFRRPVSKLCVLNTEP